MQAPSASVGEDTTLAPTSLPAGGEDILVAAAGGGGGVVALALMGCVAWRCRKKRRGGKVYQAATEDPVVEQTLVTSFHMTRD